jgi:hypothetical protein
MVASRQQSYHWIWRASGPTRPTSSSLREYWASFDPRDPKEIELRYRSVLLDDIITGYDESGILVESTSASADQTASILAVLKDQGLHPFTTDLVGDIYAQSTAVQFHPGHQEGSQTGRSIVSLTI